MKVTLPSGRVLIGKVISSEFYGDRDGWYIEFRNSHGVGNGMNYAYWKQGKDGGSVQLFVQTGSNSHGMLGFWVDFPDGYTEPEVIPWMDKFEQPA